MSLTNENKDLVWDLDSIHQREKALKFIMGFENKLCVYSSSVEQLYTNYNIFPPSDGLKRLVILPNPYAHHDTFNTIPEDSIEATGLSLIPGVINGRRHLMMLIPFKSGNAKFRAVPLSIGLKVIDQRRKKPLLPVLIKGDLREFEARHPSLHLHSLNLDKLTSLSKLEREGMTAVIRERLLLL